MRTCSRTWSKPWSLDPFWTAPASPAASSEPGRDNNAGDGHAYGKYSWEHRGKPNYKGRRYDHPQADPDTKKKKGEEEMHIVPDMRHRYDKDENKRYDHPPADPDTKKKKGEDKK